MHKLNRYVARSVMGAIILVLLVILSLDFIGKIVDQLDNMRANYNFYEVVVYTLWSLPQSLYEYIPYAALVGCLVGLGMLANSSELVVMRAAGVSVARLVWMVLKPVLVFIVIALVLAEYVIPYASQASEYRRNVALGYSKEGLAHHSVWQREKNDFIRINAVWPDGKFRGMTRYRFNTDGQLTQINLVDSAEYHHGGYWLEHAVTTTHFNGKNITTTHTPEKRWYTAITPKILNVAAIDPTEQSISSLSRYASYLSKQNLHNGEYDLAFWQKVLQPLAITSLVLVAISFIFGPLRDVAMGQRIFTGVVFGIGFRLLQSLLGPSSIVFGFPAFIAVLTPIFVCAGIGFYLLRRAG